MEKLARITLVAMTLLVMYPASAYEVETHVRFSQKAAACSILAQPAFMENLGLDGLEVENPVWQKPVEINDPEWIVKWIAEYVDSDKPQIYQPTIKTLIGWGAM